MGEPWVALRGLARSRTCCLCWGLVFQSSWELRGRGSGQHLRPVAFRLDGAVVRNTAGRILLGPDLYLCLACHDEATRADIAAGCYVAPVELPRPIASPGVLPPLNRWDLQ